MGSFRKRHPDGPLRDTTMKPVEKNNDNEETKTNCHQNNQMGDPLAKGSPKSFILSLFCTE